MITIEEPDRAACSFRRDGRGPGWGKTISESYFPLSLQYRDEDKFTANLTCWDFGSVSISWHLSDPVSYIRCSEHLRDVQDKIFLVTVPCEGDFRFSQFNRDAQCGPGSYVLQSGHALYMFDHAARLGLLVMKVDGEALDVRMRSPERFCGMSLQAHDGVGGLLVDMIKLLPKRWAAMSEDVRVDVGRQLIDLLSTSLGASGGLAHETSPSIRAAHIARAERFIKQNIESEHLTPDMISGALKISVRYLHDLFKDTGMTVCTWVRDQRLLSAKEELAQIGNRATIAEISYRKGFSDQAQFSRAFKNKFGVSPRDFRHDALCQHTV